MTTPLERYYDAVQSLLRKLRTQETDGIYQAADICAQTILKERLVHLFGAGHSRIAVEEMFPRYGSFPGFHPMVELSLTNHHQVVGSNGQRQAMFLENVAGFAERILRNFALSPDDAMMVVSSGGTNIAPIEIALGAKAVGMPAIAITSRENNAVGRTKQAGGKNLAEVCDLVLDNGAPPGDSAVWIEGLEFPVAPLSTIGSCFVINALKAEIAERLTRAGKPPLVLTSSVHLGAERAAELFEQTYDEYRRRIRIL